MSRTTRNLSQLIVEFVEAWDEVIDAKFIEYSEEDDIKRKELQDKNIKKANKKPNSPFSYIYMWLSAEKDEAGEVVILPHKAKKHPNEKKEPHKTRTNMYPVGADIVDYFCDNPCGRYKDESSIDHSIRRLLPKLCDDKKLEKRGASYYPSSIESKRKAMADELASLTSLEKDCFFSVSKSTYIIFFKVLKPDYKKEKEFMRKFLDKNYFDSFSVENKIIVLLRGKQDDCKALGVLLRKTVRDAYDIQQNIHKNT